MSERLDEQAIWPLRPWIMAAICAVAGLIFDWLTDYTYPAELSPLRQAAATFVAIGTMAFVLTVELRRWQWALAFALGWATVIALVGWFTAGYNNQGDTRLVNVHMARLRWKIEDDADNPRVIRTVRGVGYQAVTPD
jgi:cell division protein FtsW (lipid II flippase)